MRRKETQPVLPGFGILATSHSHNRDFKTSLHAHPFASLFYVVGGQGVMEMQDKNSAGTQRIDLSTDTAVILGPHVTHQITDRPRHPMTLFVVYFDIKPGIAGRFFMPDVSWLYGTDFNPGPFAAREIRKLLRKILSEQSQKSIGWETAVICGFNEILVELRRASDAPDMQGNTTQKRAMTVLEHIRNNYSQAYSLHEVAAEAGLSERHLTNMCRKLTGMSLAKYIEDLRVKRAMELLQNTAMPAAAIAFEVGYEELSTFYRAFKARFKLSPIAFRKRLHRQ